MQGGMKNGVRVQGGVKDGLRVLGGVGTGDRLRSVGCCNGRNVSAGRRGDRGQRKQCGVA